MHTIKDMLGRSGAIPLAQALEVLKQQLQSIPCVDEEKVLLESSLHRTTSREIRSTEDLPPHPRSTMDGYAVHASDTFGATESLPAYLKISGEVLMGATPKQGPSSETCYKIATGGFMPPGADAVVMLEHTVRVDDKMIEVTRPVSIGSNVIAAGDDVRKGAPLLPAGHLLRPQDLGLLAGIGVEGLFVRKQVRVAVISTGDEIVSHTIKPPPGKIRDMNGINIAALVRETGGRPVSYGIIKDDEKTFSETIQKAMKSCDIVLFSGGSSVGACDMGEQVLDRLGKPGIIVHGVAVKPGKPVIIAFSGETALFGLPGHPVSAAVSFDLFVRPAIHHYQGRTPSHLPSLPTVTARLARNLNSAAGRTDFVRVQVKKDGARFTAHPVLGKSGALSTMVKADGYIIIEESLQGFHEGEEVTVRLYSTAN